MKNRKRKGRKIVGKGVTVHYRTLDFSDYQPGHRTPCYVAHKEAVERVTGFVVAHRGGLLCLRQQFVNGEGYADVEAEEAGYPFLWIPVVNVVAMVEDR